LRSIIGSALTIFATIRDRLLASDPGLTRLLLASRVTLACALTVVAVAIGAALADVPGSSFAILGAIVTMQALLAVTDPQPRATTLLLPIPGILGIGLGAVFASRGVVADVVFLAVLFTAVAIRARGPRWTAFGTIAMMTYFLGLFLNATLDELPGLCAAVLGAIFFSYAVRFVLLPDRPRWIARRTIDAFDARIRFVIGAAKELLEAREPAAARRQLVRATQRLNETAASIESRLGSGAGDELRIIFDAELAAEELANEAGLLRDAAAHPPRALLLALTALARGRVARAARVAALVARDGANVHPAAQAVAAAIVDLGETMVRVDSAADILALSELPWGGAPAAQQPALRQAIQVTLASAVAIAVGEKLSPQRWYWAVITTYFVFSGTASSGETASRAWSRIGGTALGVAAGVIVGHLAKGHPWFDMAAIFSCLFMSVYVLRTSHLLMIFFITSLLALLYTVLGRFSNELLGLRLTETAIGAICGGVAATYILPTRTHDVVRESATAALDAARELVHTCVRQLIDPRPGAGSGAPLDAARVLEERVEQFVARAKPALAVPVLIGRGHELRRWIVSLSACSYYGRMLARAADRSAAPLAADAAAHLDALDAAIEANIRAAGERVYGRFDDRTTNTMPLFEALRRGLPAVNGRSDDVSAAAHVLERLDRTIARLARDEGTIVDAN
jgi:uncharacterized membrane protein YccC